MFQWWKSFSETHSFGNQLLFTPDGPTYDGSTAFESAYRGARLVYIPQRSVVGSTFPAGSDATAGRWVPCVFLPPPGDVVDRDTLLVVHFHGTGGDAWKSGSIWFDAAVSAHKRSNISVAVLSVEYPGYGIFPGRPSEEGWKQTARSVLWYIVCELRIPMRRVVISGRSMGSGVALYAAAHIVRQITRATPPVQHAAGVDSDIGESSFLGLVLISPFTSIHGVLKKFPLGNSLLPLLLLNRFDNLLEVPYVPAQCRLLVVHGEKDTVVPSEHGIDVYTAASNLRRRELVLDPDADHHTIPVLPRALEDYLTSIVRDSGLGEASPPTTNEEETNLRWSQRLLAECGDASRLNDLRMMERIDDRTMSTVQHAATAGGIGLSLLSHKALFSRLVLMLWAMVLFELGLAHRRKTKRNANGEWNNRVLGLSTAVRYALVSCLCRVVFPFLMLQRGSAVSVIVGSLVSHILLR